MTRQVTCNAFRGSEVTALASEGGPEGVRDLRGVYSKNKRGLNHTQCHLPSKLTLQALGGGGKMTVHSGTRDMGFWPVLTHEELRTFIQSLNKHLSRSVDF